ncbi:MAG: hypothetical protein SF187_24650 [Deltaproteobacteria bacterium]|nr:hypothetical protein [Deltaproteobacteria bacterium]
MKPTKLHERQAPSQAVLQQTPSAQFPDSHSGPLAQTAPSGFLPQLFLFVSGSSAQALPDSHIVLSSHSA